jgi:hypothetical protein
MLTRQERQGIADRAKAYKKGGEELSWDQFSYVLLGIQSWRNDEELLDRIVELCDTSNMIGLPLDKDGEVIRVGDTVYIGDDIKYEVAGYMMRGNSTEVILAAGAEPVYTKEPANNIAHKKPVTIKSLAQRIKHVLEDEATSIGVNPYVELGRIAEQLENLGDSDD